MSKYIVQTALAECSCSRYGVHIPIRASANSRMGNNWVVTAKDTTFTGTFGGCKGGRVFNCTIGPFKGWFDVNEEYTVEGIPVIKKDSVLVCMNGGYIMPVTDGQMSEDMLIESLIDEFASADSARRKEIMDMLNVLDPPSPYVSQSQLNCLEWKGKESIDEVNRLFEKYGINTPERIIAFLVQCCAETGYGVNPLEYASGKQYENRKDLGNIHPDDGTKFKGAGYIQVTGRGNYQAFSDYIDDAKVIDNGAQYVADNYALEVSCFWWKNAKANDYAESPNSLTEITMMAYTGSAANTNYSSLDSGAWERREKANATLNDIFN